uniref:Uncharacterized protein n=1 Tax=Octopus bimaculoides TaxID=37653 RepID=A0A0L8FJD5_OCTBM
MISFSQPLVDYANKQSNQRLSIFVYLLLSDSNMQRFNVIVTIGHYKPLRPSMCWVIYPVSIILLCQIICLREGTQ